MDTTLIHLYISGKHWAEPWLQTFEQIFKYDVQGKTSSNIDEASEWFIKQCSVEGVTVQSPAEGIAIQFSIVASTM